ncbi:NifB/NifX family molybdenum-iron cluster-binding protein [Desulforegula conservatrix]|uniref:NifB/NifX family molybdenum-iron cluster-binding protein n=1 Tax=Desulforegula conservatrix TaxID=153026 RepID=UPI000408C592|nr:hypothetical protein [Desulforegula conservatrix]
MLQKILIPITGNDIAPRFDLATEIQIITLSNNIVEESKTIVLPAASAEKLCHLIITENTKVVICGGIEDEYHQYLSWKRIQIIDSVIGKWELAIEYLVKGKLLTGVILPEATI